MKQTPPTEFHNDELFSVIPKSSINIIEVGCGSGALAREVKKNNPNCNYIALDVVDEYCVLAARYCDVVRNLNIEDQSIDFYSQLADRDCWIFGDTLEHLVNPWNVLRNVRNVIPSNGTLVASIPNAQHWSVFAKLSIGDFRYTDSGIFDRTHLRWFTKDTLHELFLDCGFKVEMIIPRIFHHEISIKYQPLINMIGEMAKFCGHDSETAINNSLAFQYVIKANPI